MLPSVLKNIFTGYRILGWQFLLLLFLFTYHSFFLLFTISVESYCCAFMLFGSLPLNSRMFWKFFSLLLVLSILALEFLGMVSIVFILLDIHSVSWLYRMMFFTIFGKPLKSITSNITSVPFSLYFLSGIKNSII